MYTVKAGIHYTVFEIQRDFKTLAMTDMQTKTGYYTLNHWGSHFKCKKKQKKKTCTSLLGDAWQIIIICIIKSTFRSLTTGYNHC